MVVTAEEDHQYYPEQDWITEMPDFPLDEDKDIIYVDIYGQSIWYDGRYITPFPALFIYEDSTMVPFRAVVEGLLSGNVSWNGTTRWVTAQVNNQEISFSIDNTDTSIIVVNDRIFVPVEAIVNFFLRAE